MDAVRRTALIAIQALAVVFGCAAQSGPGDPEVPKQVTRGEAFTPICGDYRLRLVMRDPYPGSDRTVRTSDCVATLLVTR
jgi:hypothetical protein